AIVETLIGNTVLAEATRLVRNEVRAGNSLSASLSQTGKFPTMVVRMFHIGEQSGQLVGSLEKTCRYYDKEIPATIKRVFAILEPMLYVFLGGIVLTVALAFYLPLYQMMGSLSRREDSRKQMANRVLGIEYAGDRIKIVEVSFGRKLKVFNFALVDNRNVDPARRTEQLNHTLQTRGFEAKDAIIATSGGNTEHRLLTLPPLSSREMHFVMQRESKKLAPTGMAEMLWSYEILKSKEELGIKKNQILLVTAERPLVDAAQDLLNRTRLKL